MPTDRNESVRTELTLKVIKGLSLDQVPFGVDANGRVVFRANPKVDSAGNANEDFKDSYILWDSHRDAPPGFGIKISRKKTYVIRRKVDGVSRMPKVGNFQDFNRIEDARARAADLARVIVETGQNPNELARKEAKAEVTLRDVFRRYRAHLANRKQNKASPETLRVLDRVVRKHEQMGWIDKKIPDILMEEIQKQFMDSGFRTSAKEQAFRHASTAVRWAIEIEKNSASAERREPRLGSNPFHILALNKMYRSKADIDNEREENGARNPLRPATSLGAFLEAAWSKQHQNDNETGVHFLILMLLWGCRKSEHAKCVWGELLPEHGEPGVGRKATSHVSFGDDLQWGPYVFFHKTKNGSNHRLPITPMALELLRRRQESAAEEVARRGFEAKSRLYVFPARSRFSKSGHYSDPTDLLWSLRDEIGVEKLNPHDLRRSFGSLMTEIDVPDGIKRRFFNHAQSNVTDLYSKAEWALLRQWMGRIEQAMFLLAPNAYNALKPLDWPPIPAPDPHICQPAKPRTGRPRKSAATATREASATFTELPLAG
jgi:integrase